MNLRTAIVAPLDYARIEEGITARQVEELIGKGELSREDVFRAIPGRTFKRRLADKAKLRIEEADAIARILRINAQALWAFGEAPAAHAFLDQPNPALGNRVPRVMARTDAGAREVEALLHRFVNGDYS